MAENNDLVTGYIMGQDSGGNNGSMFGGDGLWGLIIILALLGGFNGGGIGGFGGNRGGGSCGCVTNADMCSAFNFNNLENSVRGIQQGICDSTFALNNSIMSGFHGVDNAICTLGYQNQQGFNSLAHQISDCCCDTRAAIKDVGIGVERAGWNLSKQIGDCCCDMEKMNMQNRFDAQGYNCTTLQAIDKLGDRIIGFMSNSETQKLRDELQTYKLAASQSNQNAVLMAAMDANKAEILRRTGSECPSAAYIVNPPTPVTFRQGCGCNNNYAQGFAA